MTCKGESKYDRRATGEQAASPRQKTTESTLHIVSRLRYVTLRERHDPSVHEIALDTARQR